MLQQQLLCLIYTMYYNNTACTGVHMLTHDYTVCCSGTYMISTEWPASSLSAIFYWIFCLPVLIFGLVFHVSINTLTLKLYYRFLTTNSHFKTFFDCKAHCIRYLKSLKNFVTDNYLGCFTTGHALCCEENKEND